jgi:chorismate mutase / prephenate dehydratase
MAGKKARNKESVAKPQAAVSRQELAAVDRVLTDALRQRSELVSGAPLPKSAVETLLREITGVCQAQVSPLRVAYLGPEHSFSHAAALHRFGHGPELVPVATIGAVFAEVAAGNCAFGIAPLENSNHGRVTDTLDCFSRSAVRICGELPLRIHHCLLGVGERRQVRVVCSKPQALDQCRNWIAEHLPGVEQRAMASTSEAAKLAKSDSTIAAIASEQAGRELGLALLARDIEDHAENITRFAVLSRESGPKSGKDKTALMIELPHEPGALADAMVIFKRQRLNLTWIESFPIPGSRGRYLFFIEFVGHAAELRPRRAIAALEKRAVKVVVLGSYAEAAVVE